MLKYNTLSDIVFDLDQALDFHGNSGPYLQYTYARAQSILRKAHSFGKDIKTNLDYQETSDEEKELIVKLLSFDSVIKEAGENFAPNLLCNYLFELCQGFNTYYAKNIVVSTKEESSQDDFRILLTSAVGQVLNNGLTLLGIPAPVQM
jgi:arginyl-tRNA synthetase